MSTFARPIEIVLAANDREFVQASGGLAPEWGAGVAIPARDRIVLRAYGGTRGAYAQLPEVLRHELTHVALDRYIGGRIPRWFDEGFAMWAAGDFETEAQWQLRVAFALQRAPPLDSLELAWPSATEDAHLAYLLAGSVVQYLVAQSGEHALTLFLERWRTSRNFEHALGEVYGLSIDQLETHWRRDVGKRYGWLAVLTQSALAGTLISIGIIALYMVRRRRDRLKMQQLAADELPDQPAFWAEAIDPEAEDPNIHDHG